MNNEIEKRNSSKQILLSVIAIAILIIAVVGVSFAAFTFVGQGTQENTISTGTIAMTYNEEDAGISITNAMPMTDAAGKAQTADEAVFEFTVGATISGNANIAYEISAIKNTVTSTLTDDEVRLYLASVASSTETEVMAPANFTPIASASPTGTPAGAMILTSGNITATQSTNYVLKMWIDEGYISGADAESFTVTVNVYGSAA